MLPFLNILVFGSLAGLATFLGIYLIVKQKDWAQKNLIYLISFSAGMLLSFSLIHLLPEASELVSNSFLIILISFLGFYVLEHSLCLHICQEGEDCQIHPPFTLVSWIGLLVHSFIDGIIIGVGFEVSLVLGILSTLAVLLHEVPEGISSMAIMLYGGFPLKKAVNLSSLIALATPVGAVVSYFFLRRANNTLTGILLAVAAGSFLYVAATDLIPEIHKKSKLVNIVLTLLGALLPFGVELFLH